LIELLVATALMAIVVMYLMQTFTVQHRTYTVVEHITEAQQNSRAIAGLLEAEIRELGLLVPEGAAVCAVDSTNGPDVLYVSASDQVNPTGVNDPDVAVSITNTPPYGFVTGSSGPNMTLGDSAIPDGDGAFFDVDADAVMDTDFIQNGGIIVTDVSNTARGAACGVITTIPANPNPGAAMNVSVNWESQLAAGAGGVFMAVPAHRYTIAAGTLNLVRDGTLLATDVEDFQVSFFFDIDNNGVPATNGSEEPGAVTAGSSTPPVYTSASFVGNDLREVRLSFVMRTRGQDPNADYSEGRFQATENRTAPAGADRFRRRVHRAVIRTRNVGFRDL
jgi:Tfp pilus assembly protein PilW